MSGNTRPAERFEVAGGEVEQARELYRAAYNIGRMTVEPTGSGFAYRYTSIGDDELTLRGSSVDGRMTGASLTEGEYVVSWLTRGVGGSDLLGEPMQLLHGLPAMFANDRPAQFDLIDYRLNMMHFDGAFLERVAGDVEGASGPLLFDTTSRPTGEALRRWAASVRTVAGVMYDDASSELLRAEANRAAAIALLATFPHTSLSVPAELGIPSGGKIRAAVGFMVANAHLPIRTDEIAAAAGMSQRSLQTAFQRAYGVTALDFLRRIRLDRVKDDLLLSDPRDTTVAEIAARWGFAHLGRFAAAYASRFGEYPRVTLGS